MFLMKTINPNEDYTSPLNFWNILKYIALIIPHCSFTSCIEGFLKISWENNRCKVCKAPNMADECEG